MGDSVIHTPSSNPEPINITWSFPILDVFNFKLQTQKKSILGVGVEKRTPELVFAVRDTSGVLEWQKRLKKREKKRSKPYKKKRSGVEITVQEFFFSVFS